MEKEVDMALDQNAQYRIGTEVNDLKARVAVLESHSGKQSEDLTGVKTSIAKLELSMQHQIQNMSLELASLKNLMTESMRAQFAEHESKELTTLHELQATIAKDQKRVLISVISVLLTVLSSVGWFLLQKLQVVM